MAIKRGFLAISAIITLSFLASAHAQYQNEFTPAVPSDLATPSAPPSGMNMLELAPARGPRLPPAPPPLENVEIPSPFIGCWEGNPNGWDTVVDSFGGFTVGKPGRIVFCYRPTRIDVPTAAVAMGATDWMKDVAGHLGLGITIPKVDATGIRTTIYAMTPTQIQARTYVPLKGVELLFWVIPLSINQGATDEEIATLKDQDTISVVARQELIAPGMESLRYWHADFHRIPEPIAE